MFRCADCGEVSAPGEPSNVYVVSYRTKPLGEISKYDREKREKVYVDVHRREIVSTMRPVCGQCYKRRSKSDVEKKGV